MRELDVVGVRVDMPSNQPFLLLQESGGRRVLPIWVGAAEAAAIAQALEGHVPPRPMTHDLMASVLAELGHTQLVGRITTMQQTAEDGGTFLAELEVDGHVVQARPSDLVALAVRSGMPLFAPQELIDQVGIEIDEPTKDEVEAFREFLDNVNPDDFEES